MYGQHHKLVRSSLPHSTCRLIIRQVTLRESIAGRRLERRRRRDPGHLGRVSHVNEADHLII
jgi:hypothetical protein